MMNSRICFSTIIALTAFTLLQSCSDFSVATLATANGALDIPQLAVRSGGTSSLVNKSDSFDASGPAFSGAQTYSWSHTLSDASTGAGLSACTELSGSSSASYVLSCSHVGLLTVKLIVTDGTITYGPVFMVQSILSSLPGPTPGPTPVPTATPVPSGPNAAGSQLYSTKCASCHSSLSRNNISSRTVSGVTSALSNVGQMRSISLTTAEIQSIVNAMNGK